MTPVSNPDLRVSLCGLELKNPIIAASGTFGYGIEFEDIVHLDRLGGLVVKGLSKEPMTGNPPPRLYETAAGMLNAIGLQNIGAPAFLTEKLPALREKKNVVVFANVFGYTRADYDQTIEILNQGEGIAAYESTCPAPTRRTEAFSSAAIPCCSMKLCERQSVSPRDRSSSNCRRTSLPSRRWPMSRKKPEPMPSLS
jgi:dihydroorotate dehydrogenase (NAD+) catalytic subunit